MRKVLLALFVISCGSPTPAPNLPPVTQPPLASAKTTVERRVVVILSRKSGSSVLTRNGDGSITTSYEHLENGRGPKAEAKMRLLPNGTFASFEAHGKHTMGNAIEETFSIENGHARWKSKEEHGEKDVSAPAFYVPIAPMPETNGFLFHALRRNGDRIALLPGGEARLERSGETTVTANGQSKKLVAWAITGLELTPVRFWTDDHDEYFGNVDAWYSCVPEGWESVIDDLVKIQKRLDTERDAEIAKRLAHPVKSLAVTHAKVLDVEKGKWLEDHTVIVTDGKITALGPSKSTTSPKDAETIDAKGKALLPGLWDMHAHLAPFDGVLHIASGVTTVRDLGNEPDRLDDFKKRFDEGSAVGPHVLRSGFIEGRGEKAAGSKITAETEEEAKAAVEFYFKRGYEGIKIYNSMKPELVPVLAKAAHDHGMRVSGHVPVHMRAEEVVRAGYDEVQHVNMLFLNFMIDKDTDTRTPLRFSIVADRAANFDLQSKETKDFFKLLLEKKTVIDPTLDAFEDLFLGRQGEIPEGMRPIAERLPITVQRWFKTGGLPAEGKEELYAKSYAKLLAMVKALYDAKIPIVSGTDSLAGLFLHHELELYSKAGIPNADVLRIASLGAARVMKLDAKTGSIAVGKTADFFLVEGDPLARIQDLRQVRTTVKSGVVYSSAELYETSGVASTSK